MLNDLFLDSCFAVSLNEHVKIRRTRRLYDDILLILSYYEEKENIQVPIKFKTKFDCLKKICQLLADGKSPPNVIDSVVISEKFKPFTDFLLQIYKYDFSESQIDDILRQIMLRKKLHSLFVNYDELTAFLSSIDDGSFDSMDDLVLRYENIIKTLYTRMMEENRILSVEAAESFNFEKDDFSLISQKIIQLSESNKYTLSGFDVFDKQILSGGGFEPKRLYIFGGASGSGKSTLLLNFILNASTKLICQNTTGQTSNVYIYIAMENTIEESLLRLYQNLASKTQKEAIEDVKAGLNIQEIIYDRLAQTNSTIIMKYFPPISTSVNDIIGVVDDTINEYGKETIRGVYVDYLDLLRTDIKYDAYRLELGHIALSLKTLAVHYNIPVVTLTQLNRAAYRVNDSSELNLDMIGESAKKIDHGDFIAIMVRDATNNNIVHVFIGKNRNGQSNLCVDFNVDFSYFKFLNGYTVSATQNDNKGSNQQYLKNSQPKPQPPGSAMQFYDNELSNNTQSSKLLPKLDYEKLKKDMAF